MNSNHGSVQSLYQEISSRNPRDRTVTIRTVLSTRQRPQTYVDSNPVAPTVIILEATADKIQWLYLMAPAFTKAAWAL